MSVSSPQLICKPSIRLRPPRPFDALRDGHLCPTREPKDGPEDQGYREAKAVLAFSAHDVAEVSKERHEILHKILQAQITDSETVRAIFQQVYCQAGGSRAAEAIVLADGARWIWNMVVSTLRLSHHRR